jgi:hypothetical protein
VNSKESRYLNSAVIRSQPVMDLNVAEPDKRSQGKSGQMLTCFP